MNSIILSVITARRQRQLLIGLGLAAAAALCLLAGLLAWAAVDLYRAADYPGTLRVADHSLYGAFPSPYWRRDTSYRSTADFPTLYNWYSQRFGLGPEARAESACITMLKSETVLILRRQTTVVVCDSQTNRLVFVTRIFSLAWP